MSDPASLTCINGPTIDYTVVSGDTLTSISEKYSSGICDIAELNSLANPDFIAVDQVLKVPNSVCSPDNTSCLAEASDDLSCVEGGDATYTVVSGDTPSLIASSLDLSLEALEAANPGVDPLQLQIGQVLAIPVC